MNDGRVTFTFGNGLSAGDGSDILKYIFAAFVVPKSWFEPVLLSFVKPIKEFCENSPNPR